MIDGIKNKSYLIISNNGGGGHLAAERAITSKKQSKGHIVERVDVMSDILGSLGEKSSESWNAAMREGDVKKLELLASLQSVSDVVISIMTFIRMLFILKNSDVTRVIDVQPLGTKGTLLAIQLINHIYDRNITYQKVITELPTERTTHFFTPLSNLPDKARKVVKNIIVTSKPLLSDGQTEEEFWEKNCHFPSDRVKVKPKLCLRPAFIECMDDDNHIKATTLDIKINHDDEVELLKKSLKDQQITTYQSEKGGRVVKFDIAKKDKVFTLLLGSQVARASTLKYVKGIVSQVKEAGDENRNYYLFVYSGKYDPKADSSLLKEVHDLVMKSTGKTDNIKVVPFSYQDDTQIALLYHRSNKTITRSGGLTSMETKSVVGKGKILIHAEPRKTLSEMDFLPEEIVDYKIDPEILLQCGKKLLEQGEGASEEFLQQYGDLLKEMSQAVPVQNKVKEVNDVAVELLLNRIPLWEKGNAEHLQKSCAARIVSPATMRNYLFKAQSVKTP